MDVSDILDGLNDPQRRAVTAPPGPLLVLAGAGSGKTRVLVHRIAWLLRVEHVPPYAILAVTFTNKAAGEMRNRVEQILHMPTNGMWLGTFHGLAHRLLRTHWRDAGLPEAFQILDSDDQLRIIKRTLKALDIDETNYPPKQVMWYINARKDEGLRPDRITHANDWHAQQMVRIYRAYEEACQRAGVVDFAELLLRTHELLRKKPELLSHYQDRFQHILVDEFQDTNAIQYSWVKALADRHKNLFIVGDDDQSIYGWRGACVENIRRFDKDFPGTHVERLEQNYRSTGTILSAANALIAVNTNRLGKKLWTAGAKGEPITLYAAFNETDEARFVVEHIKRWIAEGGSRQDVAILYRSNAQSRQFEEALLQAGLPYRVYGGLRFFERAEIKDALAYLRLMFNRHDDASFERVVNTPTRGIGGRSLDVIRETAKANDLSLWSAAVNVTGSGVLGTRATAAVVAFMKLIDELDNACRDLDIGAQIEHVVAASGLKEHYAKEKGEAGQARLENLAELANAARQFVDEEITDTALPPLVAFLSHAALEAGVNTGEDNQNCVQLMTLHSAKGLEFPLVFLCGLEDGLFPHQMCVEDPKQLEEERRLCYVGITRARQRLVLTYAENRRLRGTSLFTMPSRFLREVPTELLQEIRPRIALTKPITAPPMPAKKLAGDAPPGFRIGQRVSHGKFGKGIILDHEGDGAHARVQVNFEGQGCKWLVLAYANLQPA